LSSLLDTNILVDQLRGLAPAIAFTNSLGDNAAISAISVAELLSGARSPEQKIKIKHLIQTYRVIPFDGEIAELAGDHIRQFSKSHGVDLADAAIAATAQLSNRNLYTLNTKHFPMFPGLKKPY